MTILRLPRKFKVGATLFPDTDESLTPEAVVQSYSRTYPALASATIDPHPKEEEGALVYHVRLADVQTKGARVRTGTTVKTKVPKDIKEGLARWQRSCADATDGGTRLCRLADNLDRMLHRAIGDIDPYLLPMA